MRNPWRLYAACLFVVLLGAAACSSDDGEPGSATVATPIAIDIGVVQSLTGPGGVYGNSVSRGIELAIEELNAGGEVAITFEIADDESDVETGVGIVSQFVADDVTAIIGPTLSNVGLEAMPVAQEAGVPILGATTTAAGITELGDFVFRVALTESVVVPATIEYVHDRSEFTRAVLILDSDDAFSRSSADAMRTGIEAVGAEISHEIDLASEGDIEAGLAELATADVGAFLITPLVDVSADIVRAIRDSGFDAPIIGGNSFNTPDIAVNAGEAIEGAYVGAAWNPGLETDAAESFVEAYQGKHDVTPDLFAAQGYASVYILVEAVLRVGSAEPEALQNALVATSDLNTTLGLVTMSVQRELRHEPVVQQYRDGELVVLE